MHSVSAKTQALQLADDASVTKRQKTLYGKARHEQDKADLEGASKYSVPLMTTRWAGVLTPQARVEVATRI